MGFTNVTDMENRNIIFHHDFHLHTYSLDVGCYILWYHCLTGCFKACFFNYRVQYPSKASSQFEADYHQKIIIKFQLKDKADGSKMSAHQVNFSFYFVLKLDICKICILYLCIVFFLVNSTL